MADDMMKKEVKATMLLLVEYAYLMNPSFHDGCLFFETAHVTFITKRPRII